MRKKTASRTRQTSRGDLPIRKVADVQRSKSFALYGKAGTGKTTLAGTFPTPALLLDIQDEGTDSVSDIKGLDVLDIEDLDMMDDIYWELKSGKLKGKYKTVILDTVTMLQHLKIMDIVGPKLERSGKQAGDWGTMTKQNWGEVASYLKDQITRFRNLPMNVIFIAQERIFNAGEEDSEAGVIDPEVGPALSPSVKSHLNAAVNVIANTFIRVRYVKKKDAKGKTKELKKIEYCLGVGPSDIYTRKVRKPRSIDLPDVIVDPTYEEIIELIEGE